MTAHILRIAVLLALLAAPANALIRPDPTPRQPAATVESHVDAAELEAQRPALAVSWGTFGIGDTEELFRFGLEYRFRPGTWKLRPIVGASVLEDGGNYAYAGLRHEWNITDRWQLAPSFAAGVYSPGTLDLGGPLEFRSGLDVSYRVSPALRLAAGIYHLSNGGIYSKNSGTEALVFSLTHSL